MLTELHTAEPLVCGLCFDEVEIDIGKLEMYKSTSIDHIPIEMIQAEDKSLCSKICRLSHCIWNKENLSQQWYYLSPINCIQHFSQHSFGKVSSVC
jgi:hypothetical protein